MYADRANTTTLVTLLIFVFNLVAANAPSNTNDENYHIFRVNRQQIANSLSCLSGCVCDKEAHTMTCANMKLTRWPIISSRHSGVGDQMALNVHSILIDNCSSLATLPSNAFRRYANVREIVVRRLPHLDLIDRHAFKGLTKLRLIEVTENPQLAELHRGTFSGIGNEQSLRVRVRQNALKRIRANAFKSATNLRELCVEDACFVADAGAFAGLQVVDFFTVRGACAIADHAFANTSRVHALDIVESAFDLRRDTFAQLNHVNQIKLRENRIAVVEARAFAGAFTIGAAHLQSNQIGRLMPGAFADAENLGSLVLSYNRVETPLESPGCLVTSAQKFVFAENTLHCSCEMRWIQFFENTALLSENYCGHEAFFKPLTHYKPLGCPPLDAINSTSNTTNSNNNNKDYGDESADYGSEIDAASPLVSSQSSRANADSVTILPRHANSDSAIAHLSARILSTFGSTSATTSVRQVAGRYVFDALAAPLFMYTTYVYKILIK